MTRLTLTLLSLTACSVAPPSQTPVESSTAPQGFWGHWGDGQAEVNGYTIQQPRYGENRPGEAVLIFVTETFTHAQRVKTDGHHTDTFPVMKLNAIRDFQTGIYDYNLMTSTFVPLSGETPRGLPTKLSFSMQEWCGNTYAEATAIHADGKPVTGIRFHSRGYFDGEATIERVLAAPTGGISADALPILIRGMAGDWLAPGESRTLAMLPRLADSHMLHTAWDWTDVQVSRSSHSKNTRVPAGTFETFSFTVQPKNGHTIVYAVESPPPHRIIAWEASNGEEGRLTGSIRTAYWNQQGSDQSTLRSRLGLPTASRPAQAD